MEPLEKDRELSGLIEQYGELELEASGEPFERLVVSIVNQQLSTQSAAAIRERLFENFTIEPEALLDADEEELNDIGLSRQKVAYLKSTARHFIEDDLNTEKFSDMSDKGVVEELTEIHGIGDWTAKMFLIFVLGREDVFPVEDLGIRNAMQQLYGIEDREEMASRAEDWRPYRSLASLYLWRSVD
ncbi:MAG: DNA-3-methyladenine glycosylase [Candidatus Nanohaloarchaea archaeon]